MVTTHGGKVVLLEKCGRPNLDLVSRGNIFDVPKSADDAVEENNVIDASDIFSQSAKGYSAQGFFKGKLKYYSTSILEN